MFRPSRLENDALTPSVGMNYASVVFASFASISIAWYFIRGRKAFTGPPVVQDLDPVVKGQAVDVDGEMGMHGDGKSASEMKQ